MASSTSSDSPSSEQTPWTCPMCLEALKRPKLLPCSHTFCETCLEGLVKHHPYGSFPCPSCRENIRVPPGGVPAFKSNFYIDPARLKKKKETPFCEKHPKSREIELYCIQCDACICLKCKITDHLYHNTEDVQETARKIKARLGNEKTGLNRVVEDLKKHMEDFRNEERAVRDKRAAVKRDILSRHKMMVDVADKCREEALFSLDTVTASIESQLQYVVSNLQKNLDELVKLQKRMDICMRSEEGAGMLLTAQGIYKDTFGREKVVQNLMANSITTASRPVLRFSATADSTLTTEQKFLGPVIKMDFAVGKQEVNVKKMFRCLPANGLSEVFSLFPRVDDTVWIAYAPRLHNDGQPARCPELFDLGGRVTDSETSVHGRTNFTHTSNGTGMCIVQLQGYFSTYAKSRSLLKLKNNLKGTACVITIIVKSENPLKTFLATQFMLKCGPHRAFDVDDKEILYAVVEEAQAPDSQRKVHLYQLPEENPVATYFPPTQSFQPSDVCFYKLAGRPVLLVADELNDAIHVVNVRDGRLEFLRYLAPGCPLLLQPTALNTDIQGRLWVACRDGSILRCDPVTTV